MITKDKNIKNYTNLKYADALYSRPAVLALTSMKSELRMTQPSQQRTHIHTLKSMRLSESYECFQRTDLYRHTHSGTGGVTFAFLNTKL